MKRDMDLIRDILLKVEEKQSSTLHETVVLDGYTEEQVEYHVRLLDQAGFLEAKFFLPSGHMVKNLTWEGHDWLENAKNETVWNKAKAFIQQKGGSASISVMSEVLKSFAMKQFNLE